MRYHRSYAHASATILRPMPKATVTSAPRRCFRPLCSACMYSCRSSFLLNPMSSLVQLRPTRPPPQCEARNFVMNHERCAPYKVPGPRDGSRLGSRPASEILQHPSPRAAGFLSSPIPVPLPLSIVCPANLAAGALVGPGMYSCLAGETSSSPLAVVCQATLDTLFST
ncbi:hypothetical protein V8C37DRAFT_307939 [Trichoderma ceciliae]